MEFILGLWICVFVCFQWNMAAPPPCAFPSGWTDKQLQESPMGSNVNFYSTGFVFWPVTQNGNSITLWNCHGHDGNVLILRGSNQIPYNGSQNYVYMCLMYTTVNVSLIYYYSLADTVIENQRFTFLPGDAADTCDVCSGVRYPGQSDIHTLTTQDFTCDNCIQDSTSVICNPCFECEEESSPIISTDTGLSISTSSSPVSSSAFTMTQSIQTTEITMTSEADYQLSTSIISTPIEMYTPVSSLSSDIEERTSTAAEATSYVSSSETTISSSSTTSMTISSFASSPTTMYTSFSSTSTITSSSSSPVLQSSLTSLSSSSSSSSSSLSLSSSSLSSSLLSPITSSSFILPSSSLSTVISSSTSQLSPSSLLSSSSSSSSSSGYLTSPTGDNLSTSPITSSTLSTLVSSSPSSSLQTSITTTAVHLSTITSSSDTSAQQTTFSDMTLDAAASAPFTPEGFVTLAIGSLAVIFLVFIVVATVVSTHILSKKKQETQQRNNNRDFPTYVF